MKYKDFIFENYFFDPNTKILELNYSLDHQIKFKETYTFNFDYVDFDSKLLDKAFNTLFLMAGVSYFKTYLPPNIVIENNSIDEESANFFSKTYQKGLGEFFYVNNLDPRLRIHFPSSSKKTEDSLDKIGSGLLIGIGGGKDSLVVVEALRNSGQAVTTWSLNHRQQLEPLINKIGLKHYYVDRQIDSLLLELNKQDDVLNGHIPISAIIACVGLIVAILSGQRDIVVGNEQTANEPTLEYQGLDINHQYSKSQQFEIDFQNYLKSNFKDTVRYYSFLRPLSELRIAELFVHFGLDKYRGYFSSCNQAFRLGEKELFWCGQCPKCAFIFLMLTPFVKRQDLEELFGNKNLLLNHELEPIYRQLLGIEGDKPLDCVGEIRESRLAMHYASQIYPELVKKYPFDLDQSYDYKKLSVSSMPEDIQLIFDSFMASF